MTSFCTVEYYFLKLTVCSSFDTSIVMCVFLLLPGSLRYRSLSQPDDLLLPWFIVCLGLLWWIMRGCAESKWDGFNGCLCRMVSV